MKKNNLVILPVHICSVKILDVPPVNNKEIEQILRYRLSSYYPGSVDDLSLDYVKEGEKAVVFYCLNEKIDSIRIKNPKEKIFSVYHLLQSVKNKNGHFAVALDNRIEVLKYSDDFLQELKSLDDTCENRALLQSEGIEITTAGDLPSPQKNQSLFQLRKRRNYPLINLLLITLIILISQFIYYQQIRLDEQYRMELKKTIVQISEKNAKVNSSREEMNRLVIEYEKLISEKPLNIYSFLSDLSFALGSDVKIDSLILKNSSFQLNGQGINPLGKMENFQNNPSFHSVIPYQVKNIQGTERESFSLTGMHFYE